MDDVALKLTIYFGESDRVGRELACDALLDLLARHGIEVAVLLRGVEGFGIKQRLRTDRVLTLSEDLPLVVVAVDRRERVEALLDEARALVPGGTITLERAALVHQEPARIAAASDATKLTIY